MVKLQPNQLAYCSPSGWIAADPAEILFNAGVFTGSNRFFELVAQLIDRMLVVRGKLFEIKEKRGVHRMAELMAVR